MNEQQDGSRAKRGDVQKAVKEWVREQRPGLEFYYVDLAEKVGFSVNSVNTVCVALTQGEHSALARSKAGWYKVTGAHQPSSRDAVKLGPPVGALLEVLGTLRDEAIMVRAEDGSLWKAVRL